MFRTTLNIAGMPIPVQFDGTTVFDQYGYRINDFVAPCGITITQAMLVDIVKQKIQNN
jgi:hypothetical protein